RDGDDAPDRLCIGYAIEAANGAHHLDRADGSNLVIADPATKELAVKHHVVVTPEDDDACAGIADLRQRIETGDEVSLTSFRFNNNHVCGRGIAVRLDGRGDAAHLHFQVDLRQAPILAGGLYDGRGLDGFAEGLDRYARR